jgi:glycosyltransferase involved in cell wall biosynthesis
MTQFTRDALCESYPYLHQDMPLVYPGVETAQFDCQDTWVERQRAIVSVGRFSPAKRQLEQIKLARTMTDTPFHIVGFVNDAHRPYYDECVAYIKQHHVDNVHLHPGAAFEEMVGLLQKSRYFLHTLINEPFGLTAVHAIAAGCIPIVHDSGGQRETVMKPELRYQTLEDIPGMIGKFEQLDNIQLESMREELKAHIRLHFDRSIFHGQMREILTDVIDHLELIHTDHE